jgi:DNA repair exonuclease SbcCD ATPase subunit
MPTPSHHTTPNGLVRTAIHLLLIVGGILGMHYLDVATFQQEKMHNAATEYPSEESSQTAELLTSFQEQLDTLQTDTSLQEQVQTLQTHIEELQSTFTTLQSGQTALEISFSNLFPLGSFLASNGTVSKEQMNAL